MLAPFSDRAPKTPSTPISDMSPRRVQQPPSSKAACLRRPHPGGKRWRSGPWSEDPGRPSRLGLECSEQAGALPAWGEWRLEQGEQCSAIPGERDWLPVHDPGIHLRPGELSQVGRASDRVLGERGSPKGSQGGRPLGSCYPARARDPLGDASRWGAGTHAGGGGAGDPLPAGLGGAPSLSPLESILEPH